MIQSLESLHRAAQERGSRVLAVAAAQDAEVLLAVDAARKLGIATASSTAIRCQKRRRLIPPVSYWLKIRRLLLLKLLSLPVALRLN